MISLAPRIMDMSIKNFLPVHHGLEYELIPRITCLLKTWSRSCR